MADAMVGTVTENADVNQMYRDAIYSMPIECDWTARTYGEDWDFEEAPIVDEESGANCDECGEEIVYSDGDWWHADHDADHDAEPDDEWRDVHRGEGPICEAFLRIGSLPPVHFCNLPKMAGRGTSDVDRWIIAGCLRTAEILRMDADRLAADLSQF